MLRKMLFPLLVSGLMAVSIGIRADVPSDNLSNLLGSFKSMTAQFQQVVSGGKGKATQHNSGQMALQRPGKFRWEVMSPNAQLLIADGRYIWIYDKDLQQASRQNLDSSNANSPASLLSGSVEDLENRFNVTTMDKGAGEWFQLTPKNNNDLFKSIQLHFSNGKLVDMQLQDNLGSHTNFHFQNVVINPSLSPSLFKFTKPKGVEIIKNA